MPWQADPSVKIDRFDVRAHLDEFACHTLKNSEHSADDSSHRPDDCNSSEERMMNYERYRILALNDSLGVKEEQWLNQIDVEEKFGDVKPSSSATKKIKDKPANPGVSIGYSYDKGDTETSFAATAEEEDLHVTEETELDIVVDLDTMSSEQKDLLNKSATKFGMKAGDYCTMLVLDKEEQEELRQATIVVEERNNLLRFGGGGRKAKLERKLLKEMRLRDRIEVGPPAYASDVVDFDLGPQPDKEPEEASESSSDESPTRQQASVSYITSFGETGATDRKRPRKGRAIVESLRASSSAKTSAQKWSQLKKNSEEFIIKDVGESVVKESSESEGETVIPKILHAPSQPVLKAGAVATFKSARQNIGGRASSSSHSESDDVETGRNGRQKVEAKDLTKLEGSSSKPSAPITTGGALTAKERLKRKMQLQLAKQVKADRIAEEERYRTKKQEEEERNREISERSESWRRKSRYSRSPDPRNRSRSRSGENRRSRHRRRSSSSSSSSNSNNNYNKSRRDSFDNRRRPSLSSYRSGWAGDGYSGSRRRSRSKSPHSSSYYSSRDTRFR